MKELTALLLLFFTVIIHPLLYAQPIAEELPSTETQSSALASQGMSRFGSDSYPQGPQEKAPQATGYYFIDNDCPGSGLPEAPEYIAYDTTTGPEQWHRIRSGPNQGGESAFGKDYFHNPRNWDDSTDNAYAGPIAIGFPFYYYGVRYDSFYVSANGYIALSKGSFNLDLLNVSSNSLLGQIRSLAMVAPLWSDLMLVQRDRISDEAIDFGRVYWRRANNGRSLVVLFQRLSMSPGEKMLPDGRSTSLIVPESVHATFHVELNTGDSSVTFGYHDFRGQHIDPTFGFPVATQALFLSNSTIGVQSPEIESTTYLYNYPQGVSDRPGIIAPGASPFNKLVPGRAVTFRQWKNLFRVVDFQLQRPAVEDTTRYGAMESAEHFELLLGHPLAGRARPVAIIENMSSSVGPVNSVEQPIRSSLLFRMRDALNLAAPPVLQQSAMSRPLYPSDTVVGMPNNNPQQPNMDTVFFDAIAPDPRIVRNVGRFQIEVDVTASGEYGEQWTSDNTASANLFAMRRVELPHVSTFNNYHMHGERAIPNVTQWVNIGAAVVDGEQETWNSAGPHEAVGPLELRSPVLKMDRLSGTDALCDSRSVTEMGGDTLISFPVNISTAISSPWLILSYQRAGRHEYSRGWSDKVQVGPEGAVYNTSKDGFFRLPDHLIVEFAEPSNDPSGISNVVNPQRWTEAGFLQQSGAVPAAEYWADVAVPRWGVFGGGGGADTSGRIIVDEFDGGKDVAFRRVWIRIPERFSMDPNAAKYFRFRIRVLARDHGNPFGLPNDDEDAFYLDNITISGETHPEIGVGSLIVDWPYTEIPASQARAVPLRLNLHNNGTTAATAFGVRLTIENMDDPLPGGEFVYDKSKTILALRRGERVDVEFPAWDAAVCVSSTDNDSSVHSTATRFRLNAHIAPRGYDAYNSNDEITREFTLRTGETIAYDYIDSEGESHNDVEAIAGIQGKGLNLAPRFPDPTASFPLGPLAGSGSGQFAVGFRLSVPDTIRGFQAWYGSAGSPAQGAVMYSLYKQHPDSSIGSEPARLEGIPGLGQLPETRVFARRGIGRRVGSAVADTIVPVLDAYVIHELNTPYIAEPGYYFVTVAQLGEIGLELGGSAYRQGAALTVVDETRAGLRNQNAILHPSMRTNRFWFESGVESDNWHPMLSESGMPGFPSSNLLGKNLHDFPVYQQGSWIPMIRPYFGLTCNVDTVTSVREVSGPSQFDSPLIMMEPFPNPTRHRVSIPFMSAGEQSLRVEFCDLYGKTVRSFGYSSVRPYNVVEWDLMDETGQPVPAGLYICKLIGTDVVASQRVTVVR